MFPDDSSRSWSALRTTPVRRSGTRRSTRHWLDSLDPESTRVYERTLLESLDPGDGANDPLEGLSDAPETVSFEGGVELGEVIGEGGMSLVRSARQLGLGRRVAVKMLPTGDQGSAFASELLREAIVTGMLEHPNIIPVYAAGLTADGRPALIMKRIEGARWSDRFDEEEWTLEQHLDVLMTVCRAVHFAHTLGIVHRDLKPDNVMLGALGEIYLLDWGLAVTTRDDLPKVVPSARAIATPAGTPAYWAPEMALGLGVDERTDVYLLGAILHEILLGYPPHATDTVLDAVKSAISSAPPMFSDDTPTELAAICRRAMAHAPDRRFPDAEALRVALAEFLQHRASRRLAEVAEGRVAVLSPLLLKDEPDTTLVHKLFTEARFAFKQALREWPNNAEAARGLQRLLEKMADFHIRRESYDAARALVEELDAPCAWLDERLLSLVDTLQKRNSEIDELRRLHADHDYRVGAETRRCLWRGVGTLVFTTLLAVGATSGFDIRDAGYGHAALIQAIVLIALSVTQPLMRRRFQNQMSRRLHRLLHGLHWVATAALATGWLLDLPILSSVLLTLVAMAGGAALVALTFHRRLAVTAAAFALGAVALLVFPAHGFIVLAATFVTAIAATEVARRVERSSARGEHFQLG